MFVLNRVFVLDVFVVLFISLLFKGKNVRGVREIPPKISLSGCLKQSNPHHYRSDDKTTHFSTESIFGESNIRYLGIWTHQTPPWMSDGLTNSTCQFSWRKYIYNSTTKRPQANKIYNITLHLKLVYTLFGFWRDENATLPNNIREGRKRIQTVTLEERTKTHIWNRIRLLWATPIREALFWVDLLPGGIPGMKLVELVEYKKKP